MPGKPPLQGVELCIRDRDRVPNGGFYYVTPSATVVESGNWFGLRRKAELWYKANDMTIPDNLEALIDQQICERQVDRDNLDYCEPCAKAPGITQQVLNATRETYKMVKEGGQLGPKIRDERIKICAGDEAAGISPCAYWDGKAFVRTGKCKACGCSQAKLWMSTTKCPRGKW